MNRLSRSSAGRLCCCDVGDIFAVAALGTDKLADLDPLLRFEREEVDDDFLFGDTSCVDDFNVSSVEPIAAEAGGFGFISAEPLLLDLPPLFLSTTRLLICSDKDVAVLDGDDPFKLFSPDLLGEEMVESDPTLVRLAARAASCSANDDIVTQLLGCCRPAAEVSSYVGVH